MQKAPIANRSGNRLRTSPVTCVLDRMPSRSTPGSAAASSASSKAPGTEVTSIPAALRAAAASGCTLSNNNAFTPESFSCVARYVGAVAVRRPPGQSPTRRTGTRLWRLDGLGPRDLGESRVEMGVEPVARLPAEQGGDEHRRVAAHLQGTDRTRLLLAGVDAQRAGQQDQQDVFVDGGEPDGAGG